MKTLEDKGISTESIHDKYSELIYSGKIDGASFESMLNLMFSDMLNFAHLEVTTEDIKNVYLDASGEESISVDISQYPPVQSTYYPEQEAVYFQFPTFNYWITERDADVIREYIEELGDKPIKHIIFDVSINSGGNTGYWVDNIVSKFPGNYTDQGFIYLRDTPEIRSNLDDFELKSIQSLPDDSIPEFVKEMGLSLYAKYEMSTTGSNELVEINPDIATAKRWLLIGNRTFSSSDSFANFCKNSGWATLVGTNTSGDGGYSPMRITLPNTGIEIRFSVDVTANSEGQANAVHGTIPDFKSKPSETALETCLRLIKNGK